MQGALLLSEPDLEDMYWSEMLGTLEGLKFKFKEGASGWGQFSAAYLEKLKSYARAKSALMELQRYRAGVGLSLAPPDNRSQEQRQKDAKAAGGMSRFLARPGQALPVTATANKNKSVVVALR